MGIAVTVSGNTLGGNQVSDYVLATNEESGLTANISAKTLYVTGLSAQNKKYDTTTMATLTGTAALLSSDAAGASTSDGHPYKGDTVSLTSTAASAFTGTFASKDVANGIVVKVTGNTLTGAQDSDYVLSSTDEENGAVTANITPATPSVSVTDAGGTFNTNPFPATNASVTGVGTDGTLASFGSSTLSYSYYAGTLTTAAQVAAATPLAGGAPVDAANYTVVAHYTSNNADYTNADSCPVNFTIKQASTTGTVSLSALSVKYSDLETFTVTLSPASIGGQHPATTVTFSVGTQSTGPVSLLPNGMGGLTATVSNFQILLAPNANSYTVTAQFGSVNPNFSVANPTTTLNVIQEDALVGYTGTMYANTGSGTTATLTLSATVSDPANDPSPGDIRNAIVTFYIYPISSNGTVSSTPILVPSGPVGLVNSSDITTGTTTTTWQANLGTSSGVAYDIISVVGGYYLHAIDWNNVATVDVYQNVSQFITGGGFLVLSNSAGQKAGDSGSKTNFGFNLKFNNGGTNLQGNANIILRRTETDGTVHAYQIKTNSLTSLSATTGKASFSSKATITDTLTGWSDGNCQLQLDITDNGDPGTWSTPDTIGITLWNKSGGLYFSSNWTIPPGGSVAKTIQQAIAGGNLMVHSNQLLQGNPLAKPETGDALDVQTVESILPQAIALWQAAGFDSARLGNVQVAVTDLPAGALAYSANNLITFDRTAQGYGWFTDATQPPRPGRVDLLTIVVHELGHQLGFDVNQDANDVMGEYLAPGIRRLSNADEVAALQGAQPLAAAQTRLQGPTTLARLATEAAALSPGQEVEFFPSPETPVEFTVRQFNRADSQADSAGTPVNCEPNQLPVVSLAEQDVGWMLVGQETHPASGTISSTQLLDHIFAEESSLRENGLSSELGSAVGVTAAALWRT
jgi:hypothetical protein